MLCLQETKAQDDQVLEALADIDGYRVLLEFRREERLCGYGYIVQTEAGIHPPGHRCSDTRPGRPSPHHRLGFLFSGNGLYAELRQ